MNYATFQKLQSLGYKGTQDDPAKNVITWLRQKEILRIEPYWRTYADECGYSWAKSWEEFSEKTPVNCETMDELLDIALDNSVREALL
ncbi:MAG: hypothetical protein J5543_07825 [Bacteroidales bacterium]|nr:hypothetical protein [Bacteroidales bacterium]